MARKEKAGGHEAGPEADMWDGVLIVRVHFPVQVQLRQLVLTVRGAVNIRKVGRTRG